MQSNWAWLWQGIVTNWASTLIVVGLTVLFAILKKKHSTWLSPALYGLIGGVLTTAILFSVVTRERWPLAAPIVLGLSVLAAAILHFVAVQIEQKSPLKTEVDKPDHRECEKND